jgi:hypothetical protein
MDAMTSPMKKKGSKRFLVIVLILTALLSYLVPITFNMQNEQGDKDIRDRIVYHINYATEASRVFSLPISWKVKYSSDETKGVGIRVNSINDAFPSDRCIMVGLVGKAYFLNNDVTHEYDLSLRLKLDVAPNHGILQIKNMKIDNWAVFDASNEELELLKGVEQQIVSELQNKSKIAYANIPEEAEQIKEMTLDGITFYTK